MPKKKIIFYTGSRADYGLLEPIIFQIYKEIDIYLVVGPHHLEKTLGKTSRLINRKLFKKIYSCKAKIDYNNVDIVKFLSESLNRYKKIIIRIKPDLAVILGDRYEVLSFAITSFFQNVKICHLHGGEKTIGSFDDTIRHVITKLSHYHFTTNIKYKDRVIHLGENKKKIFNYGAIGAENVKNIKYLSKKELFLKLGINTKKKIILITFHPETNNYKSYSSQIRTLLESLKNFKNLFLVFTGSNGDPNGKMFNQEMKKFIKKNDNSIFFSSLGNTNYLNLMKHANAALGNSSSAIIEAPSFSIPVINIGNRQSGRELSSNIFSCKLNRNAIINEIKKLKKIRKKVFVKNLNFKKNAIIKIANKIKFLSKKVKPDFKYFDD